MQARTMESFLCLSVEVTWGIRCVEKIKIWWRNWGSGTRFVEISNIESQARDDRILEEKQWEGEVRGRRIREEAGNKRIKSEGN